MGADNDQGTVQIALRISPSLRERIKAAADANNRSVNKELTTALEERYPPDQDLTFGKLQRLLDTLWRQGDPAKMAARAEAINRSLEASQTRLRFVISPGDPKGWKIVDPSTD